MNEFAWVHTKNGNMTLNRAPPTATTNRLCLHLSPQRGPGQGPRRGASAYVAVLDGLWAHGMDEMKHPKNALMPGLKSPGTQAHPLSVSFADSSPLLGASLKKSLITPWSVLKSTFSSPTRGEPWIMAFLSDTLFRVRTHQKRTYDTKQGSPRVGGELAKGLGGARLRMWWA